MIFAFVQKSYIVLFQTIYKLCNINFIIKNKLLNVHNQDQMNVHQKNWFTKWLNSDSIAKLREESQKRMEDIKAASVDVFNLLSLFEDDKPIYINGEEKNLKDFFKKELQ